MAKTKIFIDWEKPRQFFFCVNYPVRRASNREEIGYIRKDRVLGRYDIYNPDKGEYSTRQWFDKDELIKGLIEGFEDSHYELVEDPGEQFNWVHQPASYGQPENWQSDPHNGGAYRIINRHTHYTAKYIHLDARVKHQPLSSPHAANIFESFEEAAARCLKHMQTGA